MAKVTRVKPRAKTWDKLFGENRPIMEAPKVKHSFQKRLQFEAWEREFTPSYLKRSFSN